MASFELVLGSVGKKSHRCRFGIIWGDFSFFYIENCILCVHIKNCRDEAILNENTQHIFILKKIKNLSHLVISLTLIGSNYPCLEYIFMVLKVFEPLRLGEHSSEQNDMKIEVG